MIGKLKGLVIGGGERSYFILKDRGLELFPIEIAAIAEIHPGKRREFAKAYTIPESMNFETAEQALAQGYPYDFVYVATDDRSHRDIAVKVLDKGYNLLLEKPMATTARDCVDIVDAQKKSGKVLSICHSLRYSEFFQRATKMIASGEIGELQTIDLTEEVSHWHFVQSYVRGNWRNEDGSSPIILSKSCHDLDILVYLANSVPRRVFSRGSLRYFRKENAPEGSLERCADGCPVDCLFDARKFYIGEDPRVWPNNVITMDDQTPEGLREAVRIGPYGRCVYKCDNDVCDNQDVVIDFTNGITANFSLRVGGSIGSERKIRIYGTNGMIEGSLMARTFTKTIYSSEKGNDTVARYESLDTHDGHGGGDMRMLRDFLDKIISSNTNTLTSARQSLDSHLVGFAAEESRRTQNSINFQHYKEKLGA